MALSTAVVAAGSVLVPASAAVAAKSVRDDLARSRFAAEIAKSFTLASPAGSWSAVLRSVEDLPSAARGDERRFSLSLEWTGPPRGDGTVRMSRPGFAPVDLFAVAAPSGRRYHVTVNRL
jgi:hypothetical protein